jgi:hypothetical protein
MTIWNIAGANASPGLFVEEQIRSVEELSTVVARHVENADGEALFFVNSPSGNVFSFGVFEGNAYVEFSDDWDDGHHFVPIGKPTHSRDDGVATFWFTSHHTEMPLRNCVKPEQVLPLVREFFETDARPTSIEWEEV